MYFITKEIPLLKIVTYLKVDVSALESVGASLIEEVYIFDQEAEERDDNLGDNRQKGVAFQWKVMRGFPQALKNSVWRDS